MRITDPKIRPQHQSLRSSPSFASSSKAQARGAEESTQLYKKTIGDQGRIERSSSKGFKIDVKNANVKSALLEGIHPPRTVREFADLINRFYPFGSQISDIGVQIDNWKVKDIEFPHLLLAVIRKENLVDQTTLDIAKLAFKEGLNPNYLCHFKIEDEEDRIELVEYLIKEFSNTNKWFQIDPLTCIAFATSNRDHASKICAYMIFIDTLRLAKKASTVIQFKNNLNLLFTTASAFEVSSTSLTHIKAICDKYASEVHLPHLPLEIYSYIETAILEIKEHDTECLLQGQSLKDRPSCTSEDLSKYSFIKLEAIIRNPLSLTLMAKNVRLPEDDLKQSIQEELKRRALMLTMTN